MTLPFVVVCPMRTGSNLLVRLLRSHPSVFMAGELFNLRHPDVIQVPGMRHDAELVALRERDPVAFLRVMYERARDGGAQAFGYKLIHTQIEHVPEIAAYMPSVPDLRVVHLWRRNLLRRLVSFERARITDTWALRGKADAPELPQVDLPLETCLKDFITAQQERQRAHELFADVPSLSLEYEELAADPVETAQRVVDFLGLERAPMQADERKIAHDSLRDAIRNYDELKVQLGEWASYFED